MRTRMASAPFVLFVLLYSPRPAAAQSNPPHTQLPQAPLHSSPSSARVQGLPKAAETASPPQQAGAANASPYTLEEMKAWANTLLQHRKEGPGLLQFGRPLDALSCAHIRIIPAPNMDSEMILDVPPGTGGPMPMFQALSPCCRDLHPTMALRGFHGLPPSSLKDGLVVPGKSIVPSPKP